MSHKLWVIIKSFFILRLWILLLVKIVIRADSLELERFYTLYWAPLNFFEILFFCWKFCLKLCRSSVKAWALEFSSFSLIPSFLSAVWIILEKMIFMKINKNIKSWLSRDIFVGTIWWEFNHYRGVPHYRGVTDQSETYSFKLTHIRVKRLVSSWYTLDWNTSTC